MKKNASTRPHGWAPPNPVGVRLAHGLHELSEVGWVPETGKVYDISSTAVLNHKTGELGMVLNGLVGYRHSLTSLELVAYGLYVVGMGAWYLRGVILADAWRALSP